MAQRDATKSATFAAGFTFARRLRDPGFRAVLGQLGWVSGRHVVMALDEEPVVDVTTRMMFHETGGRAIIAIPDTAAPFGFRLLGVERVRDGAGNPDADPIKLGKGATIGMLYAAVEPCGTYVPSEWSANLLFERVPANP